MAAANRRGRARHHAAGAPLLGTNPDQEGEIRALLASAPVGAFLVVLIGWAMGSLLGGLLAAWIAASITHALVLGGLLTLAGIANNLMLPPPAWFWIPTLLVFVPAAWAGARLAPRSSRS